jgi:predicted ABC-type ATPase
LRDDGLIPTRDIVHIDPDTFKKVIPEFEELIKRKDGRAAMIVHEESTAMAREAFAQAVAKRTDIIYDTTLSSFPRAWDLIAQAREKGYEVRIVGVTAAPRTAVERVVKRGDRSGRYVPIRDLLSTHKNLPLCSNSTLT